MPNGTILHDLVFAQRGIKYLRLVRKYNNADIADSGKYDISEEGVTTTDIIEHEDLNHGNAHTAIKELEESGYVNRETVNGEKPIELTKKGTEALLVFEGAYDE